MPTNEPQSITGRIETAARNRLVWPTIQAVNNAAAGSAAHEQIVGIDEALGNCGVDARHQVGMRTIEEADRRAQRSHTKRCRSERVGFSLLPASSIGELELLRYRRLRDVKLKGAQPSTRHRFQ